MYPKVGFGRYHNHPSGLRMNGIQRTLRIKHPTLRPEVGNQCYIIDEGRTRIHTQQSSLMPSPARSVSASYPSTQLSLSMYKTKYAPVLQCLRRHRLVDQYCATTDYRSTSRQGWEGFYSCHGFGMTTLNSVPMAWGFSTHKSCMTHSTEFQNFNRLLIPTIQHPYFVGIKTNLS